MRRFSVLLGATAPAVAAALAAFFVGLGLGSYLLGRLAPRLRLAAAGVCSFSKSPPAASALAVEPLLSAPCSRCTRCSTRRPARASLSSSDAAGRASRWHRGARAGDVHGWHAARARAASWRRARRRWACAQAGSTRSTRWEPRAAPWRCRPSCCPFLRRQRRARGPWSPTNPPRSRPARCVLARRIRGGGGAERPGERRGPTVSRCARLRRTARWRWRSSPARSRSGSRRWPPRAFALVHENSVYSFATVLAVFLAGLGGGAALARAARAARNRHARGLVAIGWAGAGAWMTLLPCAVRARDRSGVRGGRTAPRARGSYLPLLVAAALLAPGVLLGLALPALMQEQGEAALAGRALPSAPSSPRTRRARSSARFSRRSSSLAPAVGLWTAVSFLGAL
jgi:hypothetical protein